MMKPARRADGETGRPGVEALLVLRNRDPTRRPPEMEEGGQPWGDGPIAGGVVSKGMVMPLLLLGEWLLYARPVLRRRKLTTHGPLEPREVASPQPRLIL